MVLSTLGPRRLVSPTYTKMLNRDVNTRIGKVILMYIEYFHVIVTYDTFFWTIEIYHLMT